MKSPHPPLDDSRMRRLLGYRLVRAALPLNRVFDKHIGEPLELRRVEYTILVLVNTNAQTTNRQLARLLDLSMPYLTVTLDKLEARGLLTRVRSEIDRRSYLLRLTAQGTALLAEADRIAETMEAELLARLTPGELHLFFELLDKVSSPRPVHLPHAFHGQPGS